MFEQRLGHYLENVAAGGIDLTIYVFRLEIIPQEKDKIGWMINSSVRIEYPCYPH
jgi:hypothetical protein